MIQIKQCSFRCPEDTWKNFKLLCLHKGTTVQTELTELIENFNKKEAVNEGKETQRHIQRISS